MPNKYLHNHPQFRELLDIVADQKSIDPAFIEKDYWLMHCLYGLQTLGMAFELKGGTSLSKGYGLINRFSEDIDIHIEPPAEHNVTTNTKKDKPAHCQSRKDFYDWLAQNININGIESVERDTEFDDVQRYRNGGIRLHYKNIATLAGLKDGVLLEVGFDNVAPYHRKDISSWAYDYAADKIELLDNRAKQVACYYPSYTLVEKLQTISTKYRKQQEDGAFPVNFMRHYYDVYCLLNDQEVIAFIGTDDYKAHKEIRFRRDDIHDITQNEAFLLSDPQVRLEYVRAYQASANLYYKSQPDFDDILRTIKQHAANL